MPSHGSKGHGHGVLGSTQADGGKKRLITELCSKDQRERGDQEGQELAVDDLS